MTTFDNRENAFENKFARDEELRFKATARRNRLLGQWAAAKLGLSGAAADEYAQAVVKADFDEPGDEDVVRKLVADFAAAGLDLSEHQIRREMNELMATAVTQIEQAR